MKFEYDPIADAAYLEISDAEVESTRQVEQGVMIDYDAQGNIVGIEVLGICKRASSASFSKAA